MATALAPSLMQCARGDLFARELRGFLERTRPGRFEHTISLDPCMFVESALHDHAGMVGTQVVAGAGIVRNPEGIAQVG